jgi:hypothetical protein
LSLATTAVFADRQTRVHIARHRSVGTRHAVNPPLLDVVAGRRVIHGDGEPHVPMGKRRRFTVI